jgi:oligopeptide transport system ATP-binding protein
VTASDATASAVPLLQAEGLCVDYATASGRLRAVDDVSLVLGAGESLGIVGESGCGKSTLGRALLGLVPAASGRVVWLGRELTSYGTAELRAARRDLQIVFQDPLASLDPRMTIGESVEEPLRVHEPALGRSDRAARVAAMLRSVGLDPALANRYPHEFSGGQCQRVGIARAMILRPKLVVCDEPVSALDVSVQGQIVNLLLELQRAHGTSLVFISHNLAVVRRVCHRVLVMYLGRVMETATRDALYSRPRHPYTRLLLESVPVADPAAARSRPPLEAGEVASPFAPPSGCVFRTRCRHATPSCGESRPALETVAPAHEVACRRWRELETPPSTEAR